MGRADREIIVHVVDHGRSYGPAVGTEVVDEPRSDAPGVAVSLDDRHREDVGRHPFGVIITDGGGDRTVTGPGPS